MIFVWNFVNYLFNNDFDVCNNRTESNRWIPQCYRYVLRIWPLIVEIDKWNETISWICIEIEWFFQKLDYTKHGLRHTPFSRFPIVYVCKLRSWLACFANCSSNSISGFCAKYSSMLSTTITSRSAEFDSSLMGTAQTAANQIAKTANRNIFSLSLCFSKTINGQRTRDE